MTEITKFGIIQIFGFLVAILIFIILVLMPVAAVPYDPDSLWLGVFHFLIPFYVSTAKLDLNIDKFHTILSLISVFMGIVLGAILLISGIFFTTEWTPTIIAIALELIGATATGLGIGLTK
jgi:hypothetical protein